MAHRETDSAVCMRTPARVLIYDALHCEDGLPDAIGLCGFEVQTAYTLEKCLKLFLEHDFPVVLVRTDETGTGLDFVSHAHSPHSASFVAVTNCMGCESAVKSLRAGMRDYVLWPGHKDELEHAVRRAFEQVEHGRFREDMLSMLTHDIKIPLSSILGYSALIFDRDTEALHPKAHDFIKVINASGLKILTLIDNFLTTSKIDSGRLHLCLDEIRLGHFLEDLASMFQAELDRHQLRLTLHVENDLPIVEADEGLLFRAVGNLLSNACKFSPPGSEVEILAAKADLHEDLEEAWPAVVVTVRNSGPGLTVSEIPEIFERFRRGQAHGSIEGSGLGAYVVKSIVEAHGGKVSVESVPNELTSFSIYLPLKVCNLAEDV